VLNQTMNKLIKTLFVLTTLFILSACESSHISLIRIDTSLLEEAIQSTDADATSLSEIETILAEVCNKHGLKNKLESSSSEKKGTGEDNTEIKYTRYWGTANYKHPNSIYLSLNQNSTDEQILEISIFEWEVIQQTEFGEKVMTHLLKALKTLVPEKEITIENL
jgi:hypothetical protein